MYPVIQQRVLLATKRAVRDNLQFSAVNTERRKDKR